MCRKSLTSVTFATGSPGECRANSASCRHIETGDAPARGLFWFKSKKRDVGIGASARSSQMLMGQPDGGSNAAQGIQHAASFASRARLDAWWWVTSRVRGLVQASCGGCWRYSFRIRSAAGRN